MGREKRSELFQGQNDCKPQQKQKEQQTNSLTFSGNTCFYEQG